MLQNIQSIKTFSRVILVLRGSFQRTKVGIHIINVRSGINSSKDYEQWHQGR